MGSTGNGYSSAKDSYYAGYYSSTSYGYDSKISGYTANYYYRYDLTYTGYFTSSIGAYVDSYYKNGATTYYLVPYSTDKVYYGKYCGPVLTGYTTNYAYYKYSYSGYAKYYRYYTYHVPVYKYYYSYYYYYTGPFSGTEYSYYRNYILS